MQDICMEVVLLSFIAVLCQSINSPGLSAFTLYHLIKMFMSALVPVTDRQRSEERKDNVFW